MIKTYSANYFSTTDGGGDRRREGAVLGVNLGHPIVTNGDFATRLFPNYFGQDLLLLLLTTLLSHETDFQTQILRALLARRSL